MLPDPSLERHEPNPRAAPDLAWDAFRYVSDAMTPLEVDDFEARLFHDQAAREAVAEAVDTLGAIQVVARSTHRHQLAPGSVRMSRRRSRIFSSLASVAMAALILAVCWLSWGIVRPASIGSVIDVALAWTHLRSDPSGGDASPFVNDSTLVETVGAIESSAADVGFTEVADAPAERPLPTWMVAAVSPNFDSERSKDN